VSLQNPDGKAETSDTFAEAQEAVGGQLGRFSVASLEMLHDPPKPASLGQVQQCIMSIESEVWARRWLLKPVLGLPGWVIARSHEYQEVLSVLRRCQAFPVKVLGEEKVEEHGSEIAGVVPSLHESNGVDFRIERDLSAVPHVLRRHNSFETLSKSLLASIEQ
jgi:hypothetical protein